MKPHLSTVLFLAVVAVAAFPGPAARADDTGLVQAAIGQRPLSDHAAAARVVHTAWEPRPKNARATHRVPTAPQLRAFRRQSDQPYSRWVSGRFRGTTDEVIQWAAAKWGLSPNLVRAVAAVETWWKMDHVGDNGDSFGLFQVRRPFHCQSALVCGLFRHDAALNADYYASIIRSYYDGRQTWLNTVSDNGAPYAGGDLWGAIGAWFSGRWHVAGGEAYVVRVRDYLQRRIWRTPDFAAGQRLR
jgi:hypothetical protein